MLTAVTLVPGAIALFNPWLHPLLGIDDDRVGLPVGLLGALGLGIVSFTGVQVLRRWRHRLMSQRATFRLVAGALVDAVALATWATSLSNGGRLVVLGPVVAWSLVGVGAVAMAVSGWLRRRSG